MACLSWSAEELPSEVARARTVCLDEASSLCYTFDHGTVTAYALPWHPSPAPRSGSLWSVRCQGIQSPVRNIAILSPAPTTRDLDTPSILATLQSPDVVHFLDIANGNTFVQSVPADSGHVLGLFWSACPFATFVIVTPSGLHCYALGKQALIDQHTHEISQVNAGLGSQGEQVLWMKYQHDSRILLLGTAYKLRIAQFTRQLGCTQLKDFNLSRIYGSIEHGADPSTSMALIRTQSQPNQASIFICAADPVNTCLHVLSLSSSEVTPVGIIEWPTSETASATRSPDVLYNVCDDLLMAHFVSAATTAVYDLNLKALTVHPDRGEPFVPDIVSSELLLAAADEGADDDSAAEAPIAPSATATFMPPRFAVDLQHARAYRLELDVQQLVNASKLPSLQHAWFVCNRSPMHWSWLRDKQIAGLRQCLQDRIPLTEARKLFDELLRRYMRHALVITRSSNGSQAAANVGLADVRALDPATITRDVFLWLNHEEAVDAPYLLALLTQVQLSAAHAGVPLPQEFEMLKLDTVLDQGHEFEAELMLRGLGGTWAKPLMLQHIEQAADRGRFSSTRTYVTQMWWKLLQLLQKPGSADGGASATTTAHGRSRSPAASNATAVTAAARAYVSACLKTGEILEGARALKRLQLTADSDAVNAVLQAAGSKDALIFASVYNSLDVAESTG